MYQVEFSIVHQGCLVNELSRALPTLRFICPGGFITGPSSVEELIVLDSPSDEDIEQVMGFFEKLTEIDNLELLERTADKAFIYFRALRCPETFCSKVVEKNRGFGIGMEIQQDGLEKWKVGCAERSDAEQLLKDLQPLGELKHTSISQASWQNLLRGEE